MLTAFRVNSHSGRRFAFGNLRRFLVRTAATTTASLHPPTRRQPKVDKTPDGPIIDVVSIIRGDDITARNNGRFEFLACVEMAQAAAAWRSKARICTAMCAIPLRLS